MEAASTSLRSNKYDIVCYNTFNHIVKPCVIVTMLSCHVDTCSQNYLIQHSLICTIREAFLEYQVVGLDSSHIYTCYELNFNVVILCVPCNTYDDVITHVLIVGAKCTVPKFPHYNISTSRVIYFEGESLNIKCIDGFKLIGGSNLTCSNAGNWTPRVPHCTKICMSLFYCMYVYYCI